MISTVYRSLLLLSISLSFLSCYKNDDLSSDSGNISQHHYVLNFRSGDLDSGFTKDRSADSQEQDLIKGGIVYLEGKYRTTDTQGIEYLNIITEQEIIIQSDGSFEFQLEHSAQDKVVEIKEVVFEFKYFDQNNKLFSFTYSQESNLLSIMSDTIALLGDAMSLGISLEDSDECSEDSANSSTRSLCYEFEINKPLHLDFVRILRWFKGSYPIKVAATPIVSAQPDAVAQLRSAIAKINEAFDGGDILDPDIKFNVVDSENLSNIILVNIGKMNATNPDILGSARLSSRFEQGIFRITKAIVTMNENYYTDRLDGFESVLIHEIFHGIGARHSLIPTDLMYRFTTAYGNKQLTEGDSIRLNRLYSADYTASPEGEAGLSQEIFFFETWCYALNRESRR